MWQNPIPLLLLLFILTYDDTLLRILKFSEESDRCILLRPGVRTGGVVSSLLSYD